MSNSSDTKLRNPGDMMSNQLVTANNEFGFRLYEALFNTNADKNLFLSPFSIAAALAMTYNGALGETQRAMAQVLGIEEISMEQVNQAHALLRSTLEASGPQIQLAIANSLWGMQNLSFDPAFVGRCRDYYAAQVASLDFTAPGALLTINRWVEDATQGKIRDLIKPGDLGHLTSLILINAIYFKGIWQLQFDPQKTKTGSFTLLNGSKKTCPLMSNSGKYDYYWGSGFQAVGLPYGDGRLSMYVFLPDEDSSLDEFQEKLTANNWEEWISKFSKFKLDLILPRFKLVYEVDLSQMLCALGMEIAFSGNADYRGMGVGNLYISRVRHKTFLEVNEEGSEAAAATAVTMVRIGLTERLRLVVDRPFFCAIRDNQSGAILFMGSVVEPD